jgi:hypothetical protein
MPLWGLDDTLADKPKIHGRSFLAAVQTPGTVDPRTGIYATTAGWTQAGAGRTGKNLMPEVLVAIRGLTTRTGAAGTASAGFGAAAHVAADITSFNWNITTFDKSAGGTLSVTANFNEAVDVTSGGSMKLVVTNGNEGSSSGRGPHNLLYVSGTGSNRLTFELVIAAANAATNADDVLTIGANAIAHAGGSAIKDAGTNVASTITTAAGIGTAAGSITVVA